MALLIAAGQRRFHRHHHRDLAAILRQRAHFGGAHDIVDLTAYGVIALGHQLADVDDYLDRMSAIVNGLPYLGCLDR
jgi:hypothetical protein